MGVKLLGAALLLALGAVLGLFLATRPVLRVVHSWTSPDKQFTLAVVQSDVDYRGLPFEARPRYAVYIGRQPEPVYGHYLDYSFTPANSDALGDIEKDIARCQVEWTDPGVTLTAPSGHVLFVPRKWYEAGR